MGRVTLVFDRRLRRQVALKRPRAWNAASAARFEQEAAITAQLEHPNIVAVHDAGHDAEGGYYTMRLVRGRSLEEVLAGADLAERLTSLRAFLAACEAVGFAHSVGVVHRDLKPANVMIGEFGETQVVDWGVARPLGHDAASTWRDVLPDGAAETVAGEVVGTPAYMAPEQTRAQAAYDQRADVWSLGAILYRLLTGAAPFAGSATAVLTARRAGDRPAAIDALAPGAPRELVAIAARAMADHPKDRYADAKALAVDVAAHLDGRRVAAHDYTAVELLRRLVYAWRVPLAVASVALVALIAVVAVAASDVVAERDRAVAAERRTGDALASLLLGESARAAERGARPESELLAARALAMRGDAEARGALMAWAAAPRPTPGEPVALPPGRHVLSADGRAVLALAPDALALYELGAAAPRWRVAMAPRAAAFLGDARLVVGDADDRVWTMDAGDGRRLDDPTPLAEATRLVGSRGRAVALQGWSMTPLAPPGPPEEVCEAPHNLITVALGATRDVALCDDRLATRTRSGPWEVLALDGPARGADGPTARDEAPGGGAPVGRPPSGPLRPTALALAPREDRVAVADERGRVAVVDLDAREVVAAWDSGHRGVRALVWGPQGDRLAIVSVQDGVRVVDARSGGELARLPEAYGQAARWRADGALIAFGARSAVAWTLPGRAPGLVSRGAGVASVAVAGDGRVAIARGDGAVEVLDAHGAPLWARALGAQVVKRVAFSHDGRVLAVAAMARPGLTLLDAARGDELGHVGDRALRRVAALASAAFVVAPWDVPFAVVTGSGTARPSTAGEPEAVDLDAAPDGRWVAILEDGTGRVFGTDGGAPWSIGAWSEAVAVAAGADAVYVALPGAVVVADAAGGGERARWELPEAAPTQDLAVSADGLVAVSGLDGVTRVLGPDGAARALLRGHTERVAAVAFGPASVWTGSWDGAARRSVLGPLAADPEAALKDLERAWRAPADP